MYIQEVVFLIIFFIRFACCFFEYKPKVRVNDDFKMGTNISKIVGGVASVSITILVECFIWTKIRKNNTVLDQIKVIISHTFNVYYHGVGNKHKYNYVLLKFASVRQSVFPSSCRRF